MSFKDQEIKKFIEKIYQESLLLSQHITRSGCKNYKEKDLRILSDSLDILDEVYEDLYNKMFDDYGESVCQGTSDQL